MSKIVLSELAPTDVDGLEFSLANSSFSLKGAKASYKTDDRELLANAAAHPWLTVEPDEAAALVVIEPLRSVPPAEDPFSATGPNAGVAFDPKLIREAEEAKGNIVMTAAEFEKKGAPEARDESSLTAIDAGKDQDDKVVTAGVAETLAADKTPTSKEKK